MALTAASLATDLAPGKYCDGGNSGLIAVVKANGSRFWVRRLTGKGKRTDACLGGFPTVRLADAPAKAETHKRPAIAGGDPPEAKRTAKDAEFKSDWHRKPWRSTLDTGQATFRRDGKGPSQSGS